MSETDRMPAVLLPLGSIVVGIIALVFIWQAPGFDGRSTLPTPSPEQQTPTSGVAFRVVSATGRIEILAATSDDEAWADRVLAAIAGAAGHSSTTYGWAPDGPLRVYLFTKTEAFCHRPAANRRVLTRFGG